MPLRRLENNFFSVSFHLAEFSMIIVRLTLVMNAYEAHAWFKVGKYFERIQREKYLKPRELSCKK